MEPMIEEKGSGYVVTWPSQNVVMQIKDIKPQGFKAQVAV